MRRKMFKFISFLSLWRVSIRLGPLTENVASPGDAPQAALEDRMRTDSLSPQLSYGVATAAGTSVLSWTGLGCAFLGALLAATQVTIVVRETNSPGRFSLVVGLHFFLLPLLGIVLALFGARRRSKWWPTVAISMAVLSVIALLLLS